MLRIVFDGEYNSHGNLFKEIWYMYIYVYHELLLLHGRLCTGHSHYNGSIVSKQISDNLYSYMSQMYMLHHA